MSTTREKKNKEEASPAQQKPFPEGGRNQKLESEMYNMSNEKKK